MVYFRLIIASFKYCQEKFKQKSFLGRSVKVLTGHVSALSNQCSLGIKETLAEKYFFKSPYSYLKFTICKQCWNVKINIWWILKWLGGIFSERTVHHWGSGKVTAIILHSSIINQSSFIHQSIKHTKGLDLSDGQFLIAMRCRCFLCNSDAMSMVFGHSYHRNRYDYFCSTIGTDYFPMFFSNLRTDVWRWFCGKTQKQRILWHAQIRDILCVY